MSILLLIGLNSCVNFKINSIYKGYSQKGYHSRGISVNENNIVAVSSYKGKYSVFSLKTNEWIKKESIHGIEDFRGIKIKENGSLILINSGNKGTIWFLTDNGNQSLVYDSLGVFLDGLAFHSKNDSIGFAYGDPINGAFMIYKTVNGGQEWNQIEPNKIPVILKNEAGFAASGTGIQMPEKNVIYIGTGVSDTARIIRSFNGGETWGVINTPMKSGGHYGIYSMHFNSINEGFIIGGSYKDSMYNKKICYYTLNKGESWVNRSKGLPGYMSCINANSDLSLVVSTGRLGTYYSLNKGGSWKQLTKTAYYSCVITDNKIILTGRYGIFEVIQYSLK